MTRILVADDNAQNRYLLESILRGKGYEVVSVPDGALALDAARRNPPDLVITDLLMPVMDGFELCRQWRQNDLLKDIPFIVYTATYTDPRDEKYAMSLGADRFIVKPQKPEVLARVIGEVLEESTGKRGEAKAPAIDEMEALRQYNEVLFRKLTKKMVALENEIAEHRKAEERIVLANRKLTLMTEVAYQDIHNKVTALRGLTDVIRYTEDPLEQDALIKKQLAILQTIQDLIIKTKDYQKMGMDQSRWIPVEETLRLQLSLQSREHSIALACDLRGLEIFTDPLVTRVFYNLFNNAIRHGEHVTRIGFSARETSDGLLLICEDDGEGIMPDQKATLFERFPGGTGRFGLFFVREFLSLYGMTIRETGVHGAGARFEITVPSGMYRFPPA